MNKRKFMVAGASVAAFSMLSSGCTTSGSGSGDPATQRAAIDAEIDRALSQLYGQAKGSKELVSSARGVLVFPNVVSAGFIIGGTTGTGALRKGGKSARYYRMTGGSIGWLAGARSASVFYLFMSDEALKQFEASSGWTAGVNASVAALTVGADAQIDTRNVKQPIIGFVLTNAGLMANLSFDGTRITPMDI